MTSTPAGDGGSSYLVLVGSCFLVALFEGFDIQAIGVAGPLLVAEFQLSHSQAGVILSIDMVGFVLGAALGGWLADRFGRRRVLVASVLLFGAFTLATTIAAHHTALLTIRLAIGLGLGAAMPILISIAVAHSPPARRTRTVTMIFCGLPTGGALSAVIGGVTMPEYGWRLLFVIGGVLPMGIALLLHYCIPEQRSATPGRSPSGAMRPLGALFGAGRYVATILMWTALFLTLMILYVMLKWLPLLVEGKSLDPETASAAAFSFTTAGVVGVLATGYMVDRYGERWPIALAYLGAAASMSALALSDLALVALISTGVAGFCVLGALYSLYGIVPMFYPPDSRGVGAGVAVAVGRLGSIVGPLAVGALFTIGLTVNAVVLFIVPVAAMACVAAIAACRTATFHRN